MKQNIRYKFVAWTKPLIHTLSVYQYKHIKHFRKLQTQVTCAKEISKNNCMFCFCNWMSNCVYIMSISCHHVNDPCLWMLKQLVGICLTWSRASPAFRPPSLACHPSASDSKCPSAPFWVVWPLLEPRTRLTQPNPLPPECLNLWWVMAALSGTTEIDNI